MPGPGGTGGTGGTGGAVLVTPGFLDESDLTDFVTGEDQLLSSAIPNGLSDPFSTAEGGWIASAPTTDPYTGDVVSGEEGNAFAGNENIDPFTGGAGGENANAFTGGQNVDPFTGPDNAASVSGGADNLLASPNLLASNGPLESSNSDYQLFAQNADNLLASLDLLAANGPIQVNSPVLSADQVGTLIQGLAPVDQVEIDGTSYLQFLVNIDGVTTSLFYNDKLQIWWTQPAAPVNPPAEPTPTPTNTPSSPPPPDPSQTQQSPHVFNNPMADSPISFLYQNDTPVWDFVTSDSNLHLLQNGLLGISAGLLAAATAGVFLGAASGGIFGFGAGTLGAGAGSAGTLGAGAASAGTLGAGAGAAAPIVAGAAGIIGANPGLQEEITEFGETLGPESQRPLTAIQDLIDEGWQYHHWFPQQRELADRFDDLGIDVRYYTTLLPQEFHIAELHGEGWNEKWLEWLEEAEENGYTADDAVEHLYDLLQPYIPQLEELGITGPNGLQAIVPYPR